MYWMHSELIILDQGRLQNGLQFVGEKFYECAPDPGINHWEMRTNKVTDETRGFFASKGENNVDLLAELLLAHQFIILFPYSLDIIPH